MSDDVKFRPMPDKVLVQCDEASRQIDGSVLLPDIAKKNRSKATVIRAGLKARQMNIQDGDSVIFKSYAGVEIKLQGNSYLVIDCDDVLVVMIP